MSSHQHSTYNGESLFHLPARSGPGNRSAPQTRRPNPAWSASVRIARPPDQIWGKYNNYRANGLTVSLIVHLAVIGLLVSGVFVSHQITQRATHETVTLIAPSPDTYALPVAKKVISGGGGGGDRDSIPAPNG